jgi:hypothetical protein
MTSFANFAVGGFSGAQVSGLYNYSGDEGRGAQIGTVNKAKGVAGAQIGVVNIGSHVRGTQIGLVNIADRIDGIPIGLINLEKGGIRTAQCWMEGISSLRAGFAFGTRFVYTLVQGGMGVKGEGMNPFFGVGMGGRITVAPFYGDIDASWRSYLDDDGSFGSGGSSSRLCFRALVGFPARGPGMLAGLVLEGLMPGISLDDEGGSVDQFTAQPTFLVGFKF